MIEGHVFDEKVVRTEFRRHARDEARILIRESAEAIAMRTGESVEIVTRRLEKRAREDIAQRLNDLGSKGETTVATSVITMAVRDAVAESEQEIGPIFNDGSDTISRFEPAGGGPVCPSYSAPKGGRGCGEFGYSTGGGKRVFKNSMGLGG